MPSTSSSPSTTSSSSRCSRSKPASGTKSGAPRKGCEPKRQRLLKLSSQQSRDEWASNPKNSAMLLKQLNFLQRLLVQMPNPPELGPAARDLRLTLILE